MKSEDFDIDQVKLQDIVVTNSVIDNKSALTDLERGSCNYGMGVAFYPAVSKDKKNIRMIFSCKIQVTSKEGVELDISSKFDIVFIYYVKDLHKNFKELNDVIEINPNLLISLANISYSTSRGIIFSKCQGTILKNLIIPILPTKKIEKSFFDPNKKKTKKNIDL